MDSDDHLPESSVTNEGQQSENSSVDTATAVESSPLPTRPGHHHSPSTARKRTNEEIYESMKSLKGTPTPSRFQKSIGAALPLKDEAGESSDLIDGHEPSSQQDVTLTQPAMVNSAGRQRHMEGRQDTSSLSFVKDIHDYQQQLELEFQEFERSLNERNPAGDLEPQDWDDLEARYDKEIQPKIAAEQEIMNEFSARFEQFMLYMQVSADHEAERAIKRLRTRIAIAQNTESSLAQKQAHHAKVLEAFQSAMNLLDA